MTGIVDSPADQIAYLKRQLARAEERLERAQSFVFDSSCDCEKGGSCSLGQGEEQVGTEGWDMGRDAGVGAWELIKAEDVPDLPPLTSALAIELYTELGVAPSSTPFSSPSSLSLSSKRFPPELFYHLIEHTTQSTNLALCLVSFSVRAIASLRLYESMRVPSPFQLTPFVSNSLSSINPPDLSLTLDKVLSFEIILSSDRKPASLYPTISLPRLH